MGARQSRERLVRPANPKKRVETIVHQEVHINLTPKGMHKTVIETHSRQLVPISEVR